MGKIAMAGAPQIFDQDLLKARRDRIAAMNQASDADFLLSRVADDFAERLSIVRREFPLAVNVGAYHGRVAERLRGLPNIGEIIDVEASERCLALSPGRKIAADGERLPFGPQTLDLVVSGLSLHLLNDLPGVLAQISRALKPDGLFLAALLGGETLKELRESWIAAEEELYAGASPRVAPFADVRELGSLLQRAGFALPVADSDTIRVTYESPLALMRDLKGMAASNMLVERRRTPVSRRLLFRASEIYIERFAEPNGRIPATFEIITLTGWASHASQQKPLAPGSAQARLSDVLKPRPKNP